MAKRMSVKVEKVTLCTGHKVYHATNPSFLAYGEGKTEAEAIKDFENRSWDEACANFTGFKEVNEKGQIIDIVA
jgi:hypothetical protein